MNSLAPITTAATWPAAIANAPPEALRAVLQFFGAEIRNPNTRRAYLKSAQQFFVFT